MSDTLAVVLEVLKEKFDIEEGLNGETKLKDSGLDSLDTINFLFSLEEETGVSIPDEAIVDEPLETLGQLAEYIAGKKA